MKFESYPHKWDTGQLADYLRGGESNLVALLADTITETRRRRKKIQEAADYIHQLEEKLAARRSELENMEDFARAVKHGLARRLVLCLAEVEVKPPEEASDA